MVGSVPMPMVGSDPMPMRRARPAVTHTPSKVDFPGDPDFRRSLGRGLDDERASALPAGCGSEQARHQQPDNQNQAAPSLVYSPVLAHIRSCLTAGDSAKQTAEVLLASKNLRAGLFESIPVELDKKQEFDLFKAETGAMVNFSFTETGGQEPARAPAARQMLLAFGCRAC